MTTYQLEKLTEMAHGFTTAALWADCLPADVCPDCGRPISFQPSGWWTHDGMPGECWRQSMDGPSDELGGREHLIANDELQAFALKACEEFTRAAGDELLDYYASERRYDPSEGTVWEYIGQDLWLSCHRHGTGLWDRGVSNDVGQVLHDIATTVLAYVEHTYPMDLGDGTAGLS